MMTETWILDRLEGYVHAVWSLSTLCLCLTWLRCRQQIHKEETISEEGIRKPLGGMMRVRLPGNGTDLNTFGFIIVCVLTQPLTAGVILVNRMVGVEVEVY